VLSSSSHGVTLTLLSFFRLCSAHFLYHLQHSNNNIANDSLKNMLLLLLVLCQSYQPCSHTIIEAHPDVWAHMLAQGWGKKPGVKILFGRWQDVLPQLETYDGIFFDT